MARRNIIGHRDGFTVDTVLAIQDLTTQNPIFTAGLFAYALKQAKAPIGVGLLGWLLNRRNRTWGISISGVLFLLSILKRTSDFLSWKARNNGVVDKYSWTKEIVLITGASSGIGARVAQMLTDRGIKVVGVDVQQPLYTVPAQMKFYTCNLTSLEKVKELGQKIRSEVGNVTVLLNNAGIGRGGAIVDMTEKDVNAVMQVNAICHYWTVQEFLPYMVEHDHGHVLTVASMASYVSPPGISAYGMSKAAALAFHESLTMELLHHHKTPRVRTSLINPLWTKTPLLDVGIGGGSKSGPKTMHVDTVAEAIADAILKGESAHVVVPRAVTIGSLLRGMPDWLHWSIMNRGAKDMSTFDIEKARASQAKLN